MEEVKKNYRILKQYSHIDYEITRLQLSFINPDKRNSISSTLFIIEIQKK